MEKEILWLAVGFAGQALFMMRFVIQWIRSEQARKSVVPLVYEVHRHDPVFITGQLLGIVIYLRNLYLIRMARAPEEATPR